MSFYNSRFNNSFSFPDYVIDLIENAYYRRERKQIDIIMEKHRIEQGIDKDQDFRVIYKKFREAKFKGRTVRHMNTAEPSDTIKEEIQKLLDAHAIFRYDIDKIKNFLSYVVRYVPTKEELNTYVPNWLSEKYVFRQYTYTNPASTSMVHSQIKDKFSEEIKLINRYFLLIKLDQME